MNRNVFACNEGIVDRAFRILIGGAIMSLVFVGPHTWWGLVGLVPFITGITGLCPLYNILGINTCSIENKKSGTCCSDNLSEMNNKD